MVYEWLTKHVMKWGEINNVREWGRFKVHHKADRNEFLSAFSGTLTTSCIKKIVTRWMMCWWMKNEMECEWRLNQAGSSSKVSVRKGDSLRRIGLKEKVGFQLFVELRRRQWEERVVGLSGWCWRKSTQMLGQWIPESRSLVVQGSVSNFEPRWIGRTLEGGNCRWTSGMSWLNFKKI